MPQPVAPRHPLQTGATATGGAFLAVGILGFVPGVTTGYEQLRFTGPESGAALFGIIGVSVLLNVIHLGFGVTGLRAGHSPHRLSRS